ncbi:MAG: hypothetical protein M1837_002362 [Sclerophora amabilis]|nr:MAG: hypothetical protein M1837_002362 [Sclerophora amabilis]
MANLGMVDPRIFEHLQSKIDEDTQTEKLKPHSMASRKFATFSRLLNAKVGRRFQIQTSAQTSTHINPKPDPDRLKLECRADHPFDIIESSLNANVKRYSLYSSISESVRSAFDSSVFLHGTGPSITEAAEKSIAEEVKTISQLSAVASKYPYYKSKDGNRRYQARNQTLAIFTKQRARYNGLWTRDIQNTSFAVVLCGWLGGFSNIKSTEQKEGQQEQQGHVGRLLAIEDVGKVLDVPVNLKDRDAFHLTIEEYLHSLIALVDELARLAVNSVTLGDYQRPLQISQFVKDLHAGFQVLNLKNGDLRRRSDGIKYSIKKIEDVVYDLSLRKLIPTAHGP